MFDTDSGDFIEGMQFWPELNGQQEPLPPITVASTRVLAKFANQTTLAANLFNYDFALLTLNSSAPAETAELAIVPGTGEQSYEVTTAGYPGTCS